MREEGIIKKGLRKTDREIQRQKKRSRETNTKKERERESETLSEIVVNKD